MIDDQVNQIIVLVKYRFVRSRVFDRFVIKHQALQNDRQALFEQKRKITEYSGLTNGIHNKCTTSNCLSISSPNKRGGWNKFSLIFVNHIFFHQLIEPTRTYHKEEHNKYNVGVFRRFKSQTD